MAGFRIKEKQPKIMCDTCRKKITPRLKNRTINGKDFYYLWCANCKTVYPSYVIDDEVRANESEIEKLRELAFSGVHKNKSEEVVQFVNKIRALQSVNAALRKTLVTKHVKVFETFGERVVVRWR